MVRRGADTEQTSGVKQFYFIAECQPQVWISKLNISENTDAAKELLHLYMDIKTVKRGAKRANSTHLNYLL